MPTKNSTFSPYARSEKKYQKWKKQGRGAGHQRNYIPGLNCNEVPSSENNVKYRTPGIKAESRIVQLMSKLEYDAFLYFDLAKNVTDIREQFPLDREITLSIAEKLNTKHPTVMDSSTNKKIALWLTTDLVVDFVDENGNPDKIAIYIKPSKKIKSKTIDLILQYLYWKMKGIKLYVISEECTSKEIFRNLNFVHGYYETYEKKEETNTNLSLVESNILEKLKQHNPEKTISDFCAEIDNLLSLSQGESLSVVYYLIATRRIDINLSKISIGPLTNTHFLKW